MCVCVFFLILSCHYDYVSILVRVRVQSEPIDLTRVNMCATCVNNKQSSRRQMSSLSSVHAEGGQFTRFIAARHDGFRRPVLSRGSHARVPTIRDSALPFRHVPRWHWWSDDRRIKNTTKHAEWIVSKRFVLANTHFEHQVFVSRTRLSVGFLNTYLQIMKKKYFYRFFELFIVIKTSILVFSTIKYLKNSEIICTLRKQWTYHTQYHYACNTRVVSVAAQCKGGSIPAVSVWRVNMNFRLG